MNWIELKSLEQLEELENSSEENPVLIFKHSTRCGTSRMALDRLSRNYKSEDSAKMTSYFLDLISYRDVSNAIAQKFHIEHESPQAIVVKKGKAVYCASHFEIDYKRIQEAVQRSLEY